MHDDADFLAVVAANPQDQLTRLVYADWLDERNDPRGELIRIEEEVRFEPAWSEVLWSQKPRRNDLRAACDPAWLTAMRYGTDCLPLFYGRPFPDHWRDGWRLIREATERWLGVPMPDVGGHADEVAAVEKRLGLTLPPSVREFVAFAHDLPQHHAQRDWIVLFRDSYTATMVPRHDAVSLILQAEGDVHWAIQTKHLGDPNPPVVTYYTGETWGEFVEATDRKNHSLTRYFFDYAAGYAPDDFSGLNAHVTHITTLRNQLRQSFPFHTDLGDSALYEMPNVKVRFWVPAQFTPGYIQVRIPCPTRREDIPAFIWELARSGSSFSGLLGEEAERHRPQVPNSGSVLGDPDIPF